MDKLDLKKPINKTEASKALDIFRDGMSTDLDSLKVAQALVSMANRINELQDIVLHMRDRKKPGPKTNKNNSRGGGLT